MEELDSFDRKILQMLQNNCRISNASLARKIGLTPPATLERVKKLQKKGVILGYKAIINKKAMGKGLTCFIAVHCKHHFKYDTISHIEKEFKKILEIEEYHGLTGRYDYLVKVNVKNVDDLREFVIKKLTKIEYIERVETFVAISSYLASVSNLCVENSLAL